MLAKVAPLLAILGILIVPLCFGCGVIGLQESKVSYTDNYTVSQNTAVTVLNSGVNGDIKVETWGKDYVELTWTKITTWDKSELDKADVKITQAPGSLDIEGKLLAKDAKVSVNYDIKLPQSALLTKATSGDGSIKIAGTNGDTVVSLRFGSVSAQNMSGHLDITVEKGKIRLEGTTGGAELTTADDAIEVVNADGDITATNSRGGIIAKDCKGNLTLRTSIAGIHVSDLQGCVLLAENNRGAITIERATSVQVVKTSGDDVKVEISSVGANGTAVTVDQGSISLYVGSSINADIEMKTASGDVITHSFGGMTTTGDSAEGYVTGVIGSGGNKISLETTKGNIELFRSETNP